MGRMVWREVRLLTAFARSFAVKFIFPFYFLELFELVTPVLFLSNSSHTFSVFKRNTHSNRMYHFKHILASSLGSNLDFEHRMFGFLGFNLYQTTHLLNLTHLFNIVLWKNKSKM